MNDKLEQYLQEVNRLLLCDTGEKERCIAELRADAEAFLEQEPDASLAELYEAVGTPRDIAEAFMSRLSPERLVRKMSNRRIALICVGILAAALVIASGFFAAVRAYKLYKFYHGYVIEEVEELPSNAETGGEPLAEY